MTPTEEVRAAINAFDGVTWTDHSEPEADEELDGDAFAWVTFGIEKSELGWRTIEFLAWAFLSDLKRAGFQLLLYPVSPPPFHNEPGDCLAFVVEMLDDPDAANRGKGIKDIARFLNDWHDCYWDECKPDINLPLR